MPKRKQKKQKSPAPLVLALLAGIIYAANQIPAPVTEQPVAQESISDIILGLDEDDTQPVDLHKDSETVSDKPINNPGNLRGKDGNFRNFDTKLEGLRAMYDDLVVKVTGKSRMMAAKYGKGYKCTLRRIIAVWAPHHENDTERYIAFVSRESGIAPDKVINVADIPEFAPAMLVMEQGHDGARQYQYASN